MPSRIIAHVDMDAFFASIEKRDHPEWNTPVIVCVYSGRTPTSGVVSSACYDARKYGVKAGMPIAHAQTLCPDGRFVPVNHEKYMRVSDELFTRLVSYTDGIELASIDEAYAELTTTCKGDYSVAQKKMQDFQSSVVKETQLTCSIGIAPNKRVAKIASDFQKPSGLTSVLPENVTLFLDPLPIKSLMGVGPKMKELLEEKGIHTILDIRHTPLSELIRCVGKAKGEYLLASSRGIDESPLQTSKEKKQHSRICTLPYDMSEWGEIKQFVLLLCEEIWATTASKGQFFTHVSVHGITSHLVPLSKSKSLVVPCATREQFMQEVESLGMELCDSSSFSFRRIGIRVDGFASIPKQKRLFDFG
ncbi:MAG: DNA polymerase IV [Candidatus Diapherotrites archaeon]